MNQIIMITTPIQIHIAIIKQFILYLLNLVPGETHP